MYYPCFPSALTLAQASSNLQLLEKDFMFKIPIFFLREAAKKFQRAGFSIQISGMGGTRGAGMSPEEGGMARDAII